MVLFKNVAYATIIFAIATTTCHLSCVTHHNAFFGTLKECALYHCGVY